VLEVTPQLRRMIHRARPVHELREVIAKSGGLTLRQEGVLLALAGKTSLEEVIRVTQDDGAEPEALPPPKAETPPESKEAA
jgi:type II secretory ATPase GspE/PulE/Tfp pilus assembly ATPase PilB-like protein